MPTITPKLWGSQSWMQPAFSRPSRLKGVPRGDPRARLPAPHNGRPQTRQRAEPEGRKTVAHGAEPWVSGGRRLPAPERGETRTAAGFFRPVPGLRRDRRSPSADALGYHLAPYGLGYHLAPYGLGYHLAPYGLGYHLAPYGLGRMKIVVACEETNTS